MLTKVHHVGVVVRDIDASMRFWRDILGLPLHKLQAIEEQGVKAALLTLGDSEVELLEPVVTDNGIARYLERKGEGLHHICFQSDDVERDLTALKFKGVEMIDQQTRIGIAGRICFLHPSAMDGALIELCQPLDEYGALHPVSFGDSDRGAG
ncbi:MAG: methylmalonyl-CoA epimerase [Chloroflexi bacterium]|nr:methylmalonyl-CoA epimerase [Chloroflexota bacterium]